MRAVLRLCEGAPYSLTFLHAFSVPNMITLLILDQLHDLCADLAKVRLSA